MSLSADGNTAIVGGFFDNSNTGAAWVFTTTPEPPPAQFSNGAKLVGTGGVGLGQQGYSVSLSADGNTAIVGGYLDNSHAGAAWVWTRSGGVWTQQGPKLVGSGAVGNAQQGYSVSLSADGNTAIVGGSATTVALGPRGSGRGAEESGPSREPSWSARAPWGTLNKACPCPSPPTATRPSSEGPATTVTRGAAWVWTRSGGVWTQQGPKLVGSGAVGERLRTRLFRVPLRRRQHGHRRRDQRQQ